MTTIYPIDENLDQDSKHEQSLKHHLAEITTVLNALQYAMDNQQEIYACLVKDVHQPVFDNRREHEMKALLRQLEHSVRLCRRLLG